MGREMDWKYTKRADGKIAITIDSNAFNFFYERNINLAEELPKAHFILFISSEIDIEISATPKVPEKSGLRKYIENTIKICEIETTSVFGFALDDPGPQRYGGFDQGTFQSQTEEEFYSEISKPYLIGKSNTNSQLSRNEGDASVAVKSFYSILITCEKREKSGPIRYASEHGGKVLYLREFEKTGLTLRAYVEDLYYRI